MNNRGRTDFLCLVYALELLTVSLRLSVLDSCTGPLFFFTVDVFHFLRQTQKSSALKDGGALRHLVLMKTQLRSRKMENKRAAAGLNELLMPGSAHNTAYSWQQRRAPSNIGSLVSLIKFSKMM